MPFNRSREEVVAITTTKSLIRLRLCFNAPRRNLEAGNNVLARKLNRTIVDGRLEAANDKYSSGSGSFSRRSATSAVKRTAAPKRVLIIEDNLDSVHALALLVADMGHAVEYAINGYVGLEVARGFRPDILLLDIGLPGLSGYEVCTRIKRDPELRQIRVVVVTAFSQDEYRVKSMEVGCELHLVKPVPVWVLEEVLG
jgi:CheY-like chemotaxis protein